MALDFFKPLLQSRDVKLGLLAISIEHLGPILQLAVLSR